MAGSDESATARANYRIHLDSRLSDLKMVAATSGPPSQRYRDLDRDCRDSSKKLGHVRTVLGDREPQILLTSKPLFYVSVIILLILEVFINKPLFDMVLLQAGGISLLVSLVLSLGLVTAAHFAGFFIRQVWSDFNEKVLLDRLALGIFLIILIVVLVFCIMYSRALYATNSVVESGLDVFGEIARSIVTGGFKDFFRIAVSTTESLMMGLVNAGALALAFVVAFLSHDSDKEYDARYRNHLAVTKRFEQHKARYIEKVQGIHKKHSRKLKYAKDAFVSSGGDVAGLDPDDFRVQLDEAEKLNTVGEQAKVDDRLPEMESAPTTGGLKVIARGRQEGNPW